MGIAIITSATLKQEIYLYGYLNSRQPLAFSQLLFTLATAALYKSGIEPLPDVKPST